MITIVFRESLVLLGGVAVALSASRFGNAGRDFGTLVAAILLPIGFCLFRAAMVEQPSAEQPLFRRAGFQVLVGIALISLLVFEMSVAALAGDRDVSLSWWPLSLWAVASLFGTGYLALICVAHCVGFPEDDDSLFDLR